MVAKFNPKICLGNKFLLYFEPFSAQLASKFAKSAKRPPKKYFWKKSKKKSKNAEFHADFRTVEKVANKFTQKKL